MLADIELLEAQELNENIPPDLARLYKREPSNRRAASLPYNSNDHRRNMVKVDYGACTYKEISNKEALKYCNNGKDKEKLADLRLLLDKTEDNVNVSRGDKDPVFKKVTRYRSLVQFDEKGNQVYYTTYLREPYLNRTGREVYDTRSIPASVLIERAAKIYLTDEKDHKIEYHKGKDIRRSNAQGFMIDKTGASFHQDEQGEYYPQIRDTGSHRYNRTYSTVGNAKTEIKDLQNRISKDEEKIKTYQDEIKLYSAHPEQYKPDEHKDYWTYHTYTVDEFIADREKRIKNIQSDIEDKRKNITRIHKGVQDIINTDRYGWSDYDLNRIKIKYKRLKDKINNKQAEVNKARNKDLDELRWDNYSRYGGNADYKKAPEFEQTEKDLKSLLVQLENIKSQIADAEKIVKDPERIKQHAEYKSSLTKDLDNELTALETEFSDLTHGRKQDDVRDIVSTSSIGEAVEEKELDVNDDVKTREGINYNRVYSVGDYVCAENEIRDNVEFNRLIDNDTITLDYIHDFYDEDMTAEEFDEMIRILGATEWKAYEPEEDTNAYIQLSDNPTFNSIVPEEDDVEGVIDDIYWNKVNNAFSEFADRTGFTLYAFGRSGRHICVELKTETIHKLPELKKVQSELENKVIKDTMDEYKARKEGNND